MPSYVDWFPAGGLASMDLCFPGLRMANHETADKKPRFRNRLQFEQAGPGIKKRRPGLPSGLRHNTRRSSCWTANSVVSKRRADGSARGFFLQFTGKRVCFLNECVGAGFDLRFVSSLPTQIKKFVRALDQFFVGGFKLA